MTVLYWDREALFRSVTLLGGRVLLGVGLGLVLSMAGLVIAWGLYIFASASSRETFLIVNLIGAGIGAGIGAYLPWIKLDRQQRMEAALTVLVAIATGVGGGLLGYDYGANREIDCCAEPRTNPFTFTALGAAILANLGMCVVAGITNSIRLRRLGRRSASR